MIDESTLGEHRDAGHVGARLSQISGRIDLNAIKLIPGAIGEEAFSYPDSSGNEVEYRLYDYERVYTQPGLYEAILVELLGYRSHKNLAATLEKQVSASGGEMTDLAVLDVGAGNGLSGEECSSARSIRIRTST